MTVLLIDDSLAIRNILRGMVSELGHTALDAGNGIQALAVLREHPEVSVALVDWNMPEMNGYEFVCAARKQMPDRPLRLIMQTTESEMESVIKALEAGADEYIMKPFTREMIEEKFALVGIPITPSEAA